MILVDSNVPMYLIGAAHPHKADARRLLERCVAEGTRLVTDAEVFQEILHRYVAIDRREAITAAYEALLAVVDEVLPIELAHVRRARDVVLATRSISPRDALHIAVMEAHGIDTVMTFDRGFDLHPGIKRMSS